MEKWKPVPVSGFESLYEVSDFGRVRSLGCRYINNIGRVSCRLPRIMKPLMILGYEHLILRNQNVRKQVKVHRLVAMAFLPNPENKKEVNHIDGNRSNNYLRNLEWATKNENMTHCHYVLNKKANKNKEVIQKTLKGEIVKVWPSLQSIYKAHGFSRRNIQANITGRYTHAYQYLWEYKKNN